MNNEQTAPADKYASYSREELLAEIKRLKKSKKYGLVWEHKKERVIEDFETQQPYLQETTEKRIENAPGEPTNLIIEGDNFEALSILNYTHAGKVDVIYIDPPYNTGNKDFIYNDNYVDSEDEFRHSKWLSFMEPRLKLAKNLLKDDGAIFISIDDIEQASLKMLCDEIFGSDNIVSNSIVVAAPAGTQSSVSVAQQHAYCLIYRKTSDFQVSLTKLDSDDRSKKYSYGEDSLGKYYIERIWKRGVGGRKEDVPSLHFPVFYNPKSKEILIDKEIDGKDRNEFVEIIPYQTKGVLGRWTWSREKMIAERDHLIVAKVAGEYKLHKKMYESEEKGKKPYSIIPSEVGRTELGSLELKNIMGEKTFLYPKYSGFIEYLIKYNNKRNAVVLDFFAGSGTTGHAVLELNKKDSGHRQFILCTNNGDKGPDSVKIAEDITYPRIKTVITGKRQDGSKYSDGIPANFRYYKIEHKEKKASIDANRLEIVRYLEDIIQVKENAFEQIEVNEDLALYKNSERFVGMVFEPFALEDIIESIKEKNSENMPVKLYVFSYSRDAFEDNFGTDFEIEFVAMPEGLLKTYANIVAETKKEDV